MQLTEEQIERLRQSGIRLDADGRFWHEGQEVTHHGLRAALWRWLDRNPDGRWVLRLDEKRFVYLEVDDAPYAITSLRFSGAHIFVRLSDDSEEELDYDSVHLARGAAYAKVKGGRREARLSSAAWGALGERIEDEGGRAVLRTPSGTRPLSG
jgi:uncharacterized protein